MTTANEIVLKLQQLGFSSYEAKAYWALVQKHPAHGYEISKIARVPPAKIYETLSRLKNKGAVIDSGTDPAKYYPVPPETLLGRLRHDVLTTIEDLETRLQQVQPLPDIDLTWNLGNYQTIIEKMLAVIDGARESLLLSVWPPEATLINDAVLRAEHRGVTVIAGIFGACDAGWQTMTSPRRPASSWWPRSTSSMTSGASSRSMPWDRTGSRPRAAPARYSPT